MLEINDLAREIFAFLTMDDLKSGPVSINQSTNRMVQPMILDRLFNRAFGMKIEFPPGEVQMIQLDEHTYRICQAFPAFDYIQFKWTSNGMVEALCRNIGAIDHTSAGEHGSECVYYDSDNRVIPMLFPLSGAPAGSPLALLHPQTVKNILRQILPYENRHIIVNYSDVLTEKEKFVAL